MAACVGAYFDTDHGCAGYSYGTENSASKSAVDSQAEAACNSDWSSGCTDCQQAFLECTDDEDVIMQTMLREVKAAAGATGN